MSPFFLVAFKIFSLLLAFSTCTMIRSFVDFFRFIVLGVHWTSWMDKVFFTAGMFQSLFHYYFFFPASLSPPITRMLVSLIVSHIFSPCFSHFFFSSNFGLQNPYYSTWIHLVLLLSAWIYWWIPLVKLSFKLLYFSNPEFSFCSFL